MQRGEAVSPVVSAVIVNPASIPCPDTGAAGVIDQPDKLFVHNSRWGIVVSLVTGLEIVDFEIQRGFPPRRQIHRHTIS